MNLLQKRRQKRPTKIGTRLLGSEMQVPISRSRTVNLFFGQDGTPARRIGAVRQGMLGREHT